MELDQKSIQISVRNSHGKFIKECKIDKDANLLLDILKGLDKKNTIRIVIESGYKVVSSCTLPTDELNFSIEKIYQNDQILVSIFIKMLDSGRLFDYPS